MPGGFETGDGAGFKKDPAGEHIADAGNGHEQFLVILVGEFGEDLFFEFHDLPVEELDWSCPKPFGRVCA